MIQHYVWYPRGSHTNYNELGGDELIMDDYSNMVENSFVVHPLIYCALDLDETEDDIETRRAQKSFP